MYGARPLKRIIHQHLLSPLSSQLLAGKVTDGSELQVDVDSRKDQLAITTLRAGPVQSTTGSKSGSAGRKALPLADLDTQPDSPTVSA